MRDEFSTQADVDQPPGDLLIAKLESERDQARRGLLEKMNSDSYRALLRQLRAPPRLAQDVEACRFSASREKSSGDSFVP